jgi:uncharacterized protein YukE
MSSEQDQLYVRVDGYKVLLQDLEAVRQILQNIDEAAEVLRQVRQVKEKTVDTVYENVDRLNDKLEDIAMEVPEMDAAGQIPQNVQVDTGNHEQIDGSVQELHSELQNLQDELSDLNQ